jgi:hypothetical protein
VNSLLVLLPETIDKLVIFHARYVVNQVKNYGFIFSNDVRGVGEKKAALVHITQKTGPH